MTTEDEEQEQREQREQLRLRAAEDQWHARWDVKAPPPGNVPDLRPLVHQLDYVLQSAAQILSLGPMLGVVSPVSVQNLKNALYAYEADGKLERGELSAEEYDDVIRWLYGPEADGLKKERESDK
jgi:hypothetical protein